MRRRGRSAPCPPALPPAVFEGSLQVGGCTGRGGGVGGVHFWFLQNALTAWLFGKDRGNIIPRRPLWTLHYWIPLCYSSSTDIPETVSGKNTKRVKVLSFPQTGRKVEPINSLNWTFLWAMEKKTKKNSGWNPLLSRGRLRKQQRKESKKKRKMNLPLSTCALSISEGEGWIQKDADGQK